MNNNITTGQTDRTNSIIAQEKVIAFNQDPLSPYVKKEFSLLNIPIVKGLIKFPSLLIPDDTPEYAIERLHKLFERTIRVLSVNVSHNPCWIFIGATDEDGYAKHNPKKITEVENGVMTSDSTMVHRYVYQYLYMPSGIPKFTSDGVTPWQIDHVCGRGRNGCINPTHLQLLDRPTNQSLGNHDDL